MTTAGDSVAAAGPVASRSRARWLVGADSPVVTGMVVLAGWLAFVLLRLGIAADGSISRFVRAAAPYTSRQAAPAGLYVAGSDGYDGQFYYRLALDPSDLRRTAFGITMDLPFRVQRIGYPVLVWLASLGQHAWVPVALVAVNVLALGAVGVTGGILARDAGRHALWGLLLAGYFGFFISVGNDLTEPVAAACLTGGLLAVRRNRPAVAGVLFAYGALTRETVLVAPLALALTRLVSAVRRRARPASADLAWIVPVVVFAAWQVTLRVVTGTFVLAASLGDNGRSGPPGASFAYALRANLGLLVPATGAAYIWFAEIATLGVLTVTALMSMRSAGTAFERLALLCYIAELGVLSQTVWSGHADLRSLDEVYLLAVVIVLGSPRRLRVLTLCTAATVAVAAVHQVLYL